MCSVPGLESSRFQLAQLSNNFNCKSILLLKFTDKTTVLQHTKIRPKLTRPNYRPSMHGQHQKSRSRTYALPELSSSRVRLGLT
jgi:hypothetical protein